MAERARVAEPICRCRTCRSITANPRLAGRVADARARRPLGRGPQRHGQDAPCATRSSASCRRVRAPSASRARDLIGLEPHLIAREGVGYVPQGRRLWPSLSVDETLAPGRAAARRRHGPSTAFTRFSRGSRSGAATAAGSFPAASSRCSRSRGRCSAIRASCHGRADRRARADDRRADARSADPSRP